MTKINNTIFQSYTQCL
jgi:hypothetical protein